jgi:hypothetical protein
MLITKKRRFLFNMKMTFLLSATLSSIKFCILNKTNNTKTFSQSIIIIENKNEYYIFIFIPHQAKLSVFVIVINPV